MPKIGQAEAIKKAEKAAKKWYERNKDRIDGGTYTSVYNTGPDQEEHLDVWVSTTLQETIRRAWKDKDDWNGLERRASFSSGETKFDLKLAYKDSGATRSLFNYHMPFKADESVDIVRHQQSKSDKKLAKQFKVEQDKLKPTEKQIKTQRVVARTQKANQEQLEVKANTAWNSMLKKTKKKPKVEEAEWKRLWKEKWLELHPEDK